MKKRAVIMSALLTFMTSKKSLLIATGSIFITTVVMLILPFSVSGAFSKTYFCRQRFNTRGNENNHKIILDVYASSLSIKEVESENNTGFDPLKSLETNHL